MVGYGRVWYVRGGVGYCREWYGKGNGRIGYGRVGR